MHIYPDYAELQHYDRVHVPPQSDIIHALLEIATFYSCNEYWMVIHHVTSAHLLYT